MNKLMIAAAVCAAALIGSGAALGVAAENAPKTIELEDSAETYYDPIVYASGSMTEGSSALPYSSAYPSSSSRPYSSSSSYYPDSSDYSSDSESHWLRDTSGEGYCDWELLTDGTLTISGTGYLSIYDDEPWKDNIDKVKKIVIENGIQGLSSDLFLNYPNLTTVKIGDTVKSISHGCFSGCTSLRSVTIGSGLTQIYHGAFSY